VPNIHQNNSCAVSACFCSGKFLPSLNTEKRAGGPPIFEEPPLFPPPSPLGLILTFSVPTWLEQKKVVFSTHVQRQAYLILY